MERLYSPWRTDYVTSNDKIKGCVFCHISENEQDDEKLGVLYRDDKCIVVMNKYPYSPGHFMVVPHLHTDNIESLDPLIWSHISLKVQQGVALLKSVLNASGVNLGMNLGKAGGAGIEQHVHYHLVPRWLGDTNFITSIGGTRVYSTDFERIYKKLKENSSKYFV